MTKARGCLDDLSSAEQRVLSLRAGVGAGPPRLRASVARRLNISVRRVARLERDGLKRLRSLARGGGCAPSAASSRATGVTDSALVGTTAGGASAISGTSGGGGGKATNGGHGHGHARADRSRGGGGAQGGGGKAGSSGGTGSSGSRGGVAGVTATQPPGSGSDLGFLLLLLALGAAAALVALFVTRRDEAMAFVAGLRRRREPERAAPRAATFARREEPEAPAPERRPTPRQPPSGPSWTEPRPDSGADTWSSAPPPAPSEHEPWSPPRSWDGARR